MSSRKMIEIDGSVGEGGGQVLRTSLALAAVLGRKVRIFNIRAGRAEPGLKAQHLTSATAVTRICGAASEGLKIGSTEFTFSPGRIRAGSFRFDVGTAGSITLVLQTLMPLLPFAPGPVELEITGGTDVKWSPPIDYVRLVTVPLLEKMNVHASIFVSRRGHFPKGGGIVRLSATPTSIMKNFLGGASGVVNIVEGVSHSVQLPVGVAERQAMAATRVIEEGNLPRPRIRIEHSESGSGPGSGIVLSALTSNGALLGGDSLGERGRPAEVVGEDAAGKLVKEMSSGGFLDRHMGDVIVPYAALAEGVSDATLSQVTLHTLTNVKVAEHVAGVHFDPLSQVGMPGRLRVSGLGLRREEVSVSPRE
ncbi:MAG TPA: RNA 3'-terminal phosphate cyclase [Candidatus Angelobacter sp.]|nr:RNA 3'-terminal phosphate cyclase [Candidatus Angelobacter sp.]